MNKVISISLFAASIFLISCTTTPTQTSQADQADLRQPAQANNGIEFDLMHTKLNCKYVGYQPTFCEMKNDSNEMEASAGMVSKINGQLDRALKSPSKAQVFIAYFSFSNKKVHTKLCEIAKKGVSIRIFLDAGSAGNIDTLRTNSACQGEGIDSGSSNSKFKISYLGGLTGQPWRLHHNKFLYVNPGTGDKVNVNYSSGNLSSFGTSLHLDHWVTALAPEKSNLIRSYQCVMEGLETAVGKSFDYSKGIPNNSINTSDPINHSSENDYQVAQSYIQQRESCFKRLKTSGSGGIEQAIAQERIAPLFAPNEDHIVLKSFVKEAMKVPNNGYIYIAIQHFLNPGIGNALIQAAVRGVDVRIIMDDDVVTNKGEVQGAMEFLNGLQAQSKKIKVRFIESNHLAGGNGSMMHNKFAIFNGNRILSGAGQYTTAGLKNNWENFGLTQDNGLTRKYIEYFKELWEVSVDNVYVKNQLQKNEAFQELSESQLLQAGFSKSEIASYKRNDGKIFGTLTSKQAIRTQPESLHPGALKLIGL